MYSPPMLYKTSSTGAELEWRICTRPFVEGDGPVPAILHADQPWEIVTYHGQVGGKIQETTVTISAGKNVGRTNETSIEQQADSEAQSKYAKQLDKSYSTERGGDSKEYKPMLAHSYDDHKKKVTFPCYIQPKLDGMRCIAIREGGNITFMSRGNKEIPGLNHIKQELLQFMEDGEVWDGELYNHDINFQTVISLIKRPQDGSEKVQYHVYDVISKDDFRTRFLNDRMVNLGVMGYNNVCEVMSYKCDSHEEIIEWHNKFVKWGYEGAIVRNGDCTYKEGGRSNQLLKVKQFFDAEFEIAEVIPAEKQPTHAIFVCQMTGTNVTFKATPEGSFELKERYLRDRMSLIGKMATIRYFELTTSEIPVPRFPIMVNIRENGE